MQIKIPTNTYNVKFFLTLLFFCVSCSLIFAQEQQKDTINEFKNFRFGGYGEILFQHMNYGPNRYKDPLGAPADNRSYVSLPRVIFAGDYKFRDDIILSSELEIEYGGTGSAMEFEYAEAGEYEMEIEKGGEIMLEQLHITKRFWDAFNVRIGHMIVPVGLTNAHHEPIFFFTTIRPEGEMVMLPCTWHETGVAVLGKVLDFNYNFMLVNGLDPNGFSTENWVGSGKQGIFETSIMTNPAFAGRIEYSGIKGLRAGISGYYTHSTAKNSTKPQNMTGVTGRIRIFSSDIQYANYNVVARANVVYGNLSDSKEISQINRRNFTKTSYPCTDVAESALTYAAEVGYNVLSFFNSKQKLYPFLRYEYYNTAETVETGAKEHPRYERDLFTFGLNYFILPNLDLKLDYSIRRIDAGNYNNENTLGIAVAYTGWFFKK